MLSSEEPFRRHLPQLWLLPLLDNSNVNYYLIVFLPRRRIFNWTTLFTCFTHHNSTYIHHVSLCKEPESCNSSALKKYILNYVICPFSLTIPQMSALVWFRWERLPVNARDRQTDRHSNVEIPSSPMLVFPLVATLHCNCVTGQQLRSQDSQLIKQQMNQTKIYESTLRCNFFIPLTEVTLSPKHEI